MKWAILKYSTENIGDDIQSLAIRRFLPRIDTEVDRDHLNELATRNGEPCGIVLNGWFSHRPENFILGEEIRPLLISMHFSRYSGYNPTGRTAADTLVTGQHAKILKKWGPVGARDAHTLAILREASIPSYFSACATLTFMAPKSRKRSDAIACVDVDQQVYDFVAEGTRRPTIARSHYIDPSMPQAERRNLASELISTYASVAAVVTTRLHAALPALAMGTPVLLLDTAPDQERFRGLGTLLRHTTPEEFLSRPWPLDASLLTPNWSHFRSLAYLLQARIEEFVVRLSQM